MVRNLLRLNGLAILCVVLFHASGWGFTDMFFWVHRYLPVTSPDFSQAGSFSYYILRAVEQLVVFSIPAFLFVSGFFIAFSAGRSTTLSWQLIWQRVKRMLIPYLLWSTLLILLRVLEGNPPALAAIPRMILTGSTSPAYYFIPLLIQFYLLAPLLVPLARRHWKILLAVTIVVQVGVHLLHYPWLLTADPALQLSMAALIPKWLFVKRLFWVSFGLIAGFHLPAIKAFAVRFKVLWPAAAVVLFIAGMWEWEALLRLAGVPWLEMVETLVDALYGAAILLTFFAYSDLPLPFARQLEDLGSRSFGIYLVHPPVQLYLAKVIYHFLPGLLAYPLLFAALMFAAGLFVPLTWMWLVNRSPARALYTYQFG